MIITSVNNKHIKELCKLKDKKYRDNSGLFLVETYHLVEEAIKNNCVREVIVCDGYDIDTSINKIIVSNEVMNKLSSTNTNPKVIGVCNKIIESNNLGNKILILDDVQDPGNLGAIIRSAVAFNFDTIVLSDNCVDLYNSKVIRASEGMLFNINIIRRSLIPFIKELKNNNYLILSTDVNDGVNVRDVDIKNKYAFVIGNEGNGVSVEVNELCDYYLYIDINNRCESLNASVAASIIMYELNNK